MLVNRTDDIWSIALPRDDGHNDDIQEVLGEGASLVEPKAESHISKEEQETGC